MKILVIEDNPTNMRLATIVLENAGHVVVPADNAADGIALAHAERPNLILMDIQLPGMDGLTATRMLKADAATCGIPVVALTSYAMKGDDEKMRAAGCDGYLAKPFHYPDLLAAVVRHGRGWETMGLQGRGELP